MSLADNAVAVMLPIADADRAQAFYGDRLGLPFDGKGDEGELMFRLAGGSTLVLRELPDVEPSPNTNITKDNSNSGRGNACTHQPINTSSHCRIALPESARSKLRPHSRQASRIDAYDCTSMMRDPSRNPTRAPRRASCRASVTSSLNDVRAGAYPPCSSNSERRARKHCPFASTRSGEAAAPAAPVR